MKNNPQKYLAAVDPVLKLLIDKLPIPQMKSRENLYRFLIEAIISQQLSDKAATTITKRFISLFSPQAFPSPSVILSAESNLIRTAGISFSKISYMKDVAQKAQVGYLDPKHIKDLSDKQIIDYLTQIKGIGRWSAEMTLIFALKREDVFSYGDAGLRSAIERHYKVRKPLSEKVANKISYKWKPYRSLACRYLWASLDLPK